LKTFILFLAVAVVEIKDMLHALHFKKKSTPCAEEKQQEFSKSAESKDIPYHRIKEFFIVKL